MFSVEYWRDLEIWARGSFKVFTASDFLSRVNVSTPTRDIDIANLSVCLSVRLSVTFRYQMKTA